MKSLELFKQSGEPMIVIDENGEQLTLVPYSAVDVPGPEEELKLWQL